MSYLRLIRFPNLLIVALTQYLLQYCILLPHFKAHNLSPALDDLHFLLFVFTTIIIAGGGYIINDLEDIEIDRINKPERMVIGAQMSERFGRGLYYAFNVVGMGLSIYLAIHVGELGLAAIFPVAVLLLWWYSRQLKKLPFWGNLTVAVFCAFVAGVVLFAERAAFTDLLRVAPVEAMEVSRLFLAYLVFAFLSTLFRELVKDIEDVQGDQQLNCRTLPIVLGIKESKMLSFGLGFLLLLAVLYWSVDLWSKAQWLNLIYTILGIIAPLLLSLFLLYRATNKSDYSRLSKLAKYLMLSGILYLIGYSIL